MPRKSKNKIKRLEWADSTQSKWFLAAGLTTTVLCSLFVCYSSIIFPQLNTTPGALPVLFALLFVSLLSFPISIGVFPWFYATQWFVNEEFISYFVPAPKVGGKTWNIRNENFKELRDGRFFVSMIRTDGTRLLAPKTLSITKGDGVKARASFAIANGKVLITRL